MKDENEEMRHVFDALQIDNGAFTGEEYIKAKGTTKHAKSRDEDDLMPYILITYASYQTQNDDALLEFINKTCVNSDIR